MSMTHGSISLDGEPWKVESFTAKMRRGGPYYTLAERPDESWVFVDAAGHEHRWVDNVVTNSRWVSDGTYYCVDCNDEHETGHTECSICGERITPGTHPDDRPFYVDGPTDWTVKVIDTAGRIRMDNEPITVEVRGQRGVLYATGWERRHDGLTYVTLVGGPTA